MLRFVEYLRTGAQRPVVPLQLNPAGTGGGVDATLLRFFEDSAKTRRPMWLKFGTALRPSLLHLPWKCHGRVGSGHGVMVSYMTSCSVEIGGFCDLSYLGEFHCFLPSGVGCCIVGSINGVKVYLEVIYSCHGVKVTQGHACHGPFP